MMYDRLGDFDSFVQPRQLAHAMSAASISVWTKMVSCICWRSHLPGLNREQSDLCIMAAAEGMPYETLITEILYLAAERYGMQIPVAA